MFSKLDNLISKTMEYIMVITLMIAIIATFIQVILRYFLHISMPWSQEFLMVCFVYSVFSGAAFLASRNEHLVVDLFDKLPPKIDFLLSLLESIIVIFVSIIFIYYGIDLVIKNFESSQMLASLPIKRAWLYLSVPISSLAIIYFYIRKLVKLCLG